jgi:predicted secreted Zn-dependent protease
MTANPIIDPDDGPAYANLTHDHTVALATAMSGGTCRVTDLTFRWKFVLTLPQAADYDRMNGPTKKMWTDFKASLKKHEEGHRTIFLKCGASFVPAAAKLTAGTCAALERDVRKYLDRQYAACMGKQSDYEKIDRPRVMSSPFIRAALGR